jgi:hypothetical protein
MAVFEHGRGRGRLRWSTGQRHQSKRYAQKALRQTHCRVPFRFLQENGRTIQPGCSIRLLLVSRRHSLAEDGSGSQIDGVPTG